MGLLVIVAIVLFAVFSPPKKSADQPATPPPEQQAAKVAPTPAPAPTTPPGKSDLQPIIEGMVNTGMLLRFDLASGEFYVDSVTWMTSTVDDKRTMVKGFSKYREDMKGLPQVTVLDSHSGHKLADYGVFSGITIY